MLLFLMFTCQIAAFSWELATPESQGMSGEKLEALGRRLEGKGTNAFLIIRHDKIVYERYAPGFSRNRLHPTASLAKALIGGTSLILALSDGYMTPDDPACKYITEWKDDPVKSRITIRHLATHSSGISDAGSIDGGLGQFWTHPSRVARDMTPVAFTPGTGYEYTNLGMAMLSYCISSALKGAPESDLKTLITERVMRPIGIPDAEWNMSYGKSAKEGGLKIYANWGGANFTPDALARVGRLMLHKGKWDGKQILSSEWVEKAASDAGAPAPDRGNGPAPRSGLCWWVNSDGVWDKVPRDAFAGAGAGNQILLIVPSLDLIVVRNGSQIDRSSFWRGVKRHLFDPLMEAFEGNELK